MNSRQIEYILTLAEEGSFSAASRKLLVSQPSLSQFVQKLEADLGVTLFERTQPLRLTDHGRVYCETAKRILIEEEIMRKRFLDIDDAQEGTLIIGASHYCASWIVPPLIATYHEQNPNVRIYIKEYAETSLKEHADNNEFDFIISAFAYDDSNYVCQPILNENFMLTCSNHFYAENPHLFPQDYLSIVKLQNFKEVPFICMDEGFPQYTIFNNLCHHELFEPKIVAYCESLSTIISLVSQDMGVAILPNGMLSSRKNNGILMFNLSKHPYTRSINILYKQHQYISNIAQKFIDISLNQ